MNRREYEKELTPVTYNAAAVKILHIDRRKEGEICFRMHWHERMEILRIHSGSLQVDFGTGIRTFGPDTLVIISPNQPHKGICVQVPVCYDVIMFDVRSYYNETEICRNLLPQVFDGRIRFEPGCRDRMVLQCVDDISASPDSEAGTLEMLSRIYRLFGLLYAGHPREVLMPGPFDEKIRQITAYMHSHFDSELTTESLCALFRYAKPYFCRKFKESTGLTPMAYLKILRMEKAGHLLKNGGGNVNEVALQCGFTDPNYFTRCFKAHFGCPPSDYIPTGGRKGKRAGITGRAYK